jgi:hydrogenase maturation protease
MHSDSNDKGPDKDFLLMGLGNLLMEDEGVGVHVLRHLEEHYTFKPPLEFVDGGTAGFELLPFFEDYRHILMVDAVEFRKEPGHIGTIKNDDILTQLTQKMSLHHLGITDVLSAAKLLDYTFDEVVLIGIQPYFFNDVKMGLSKEMEARMPDIVKTTLNELDRWGIQAIRNEQDK